MSSRAELSYSNYNGSASGEVRTFFHYGTGFPPSGLDFPQKMIGTQNSPISGTEKITLIYSLIFFLF
jgi:hypothetical protein